MRRSPSLWFLPFLLPAFVLGCGNPEELSPDAEDAVAVPGGKADDLEYAPCLGEAVVNLINDVGTTTDSLRAGGLHTRAARNLITRRNGPDGVSDTADDVVFADINEIDAVSYVGPVALRQLTSMVMCPNTSADVQVIFSPQPYDRSHLARAVELIDGAQTSLDIAMYSLSDGGVMNALERAATRGISIRMVFHPAQAEQRRPAGTRSARLEEMGIDVRYINKTMHHKFVLVDGPRGDASLVTGTLMTGSGNWSNSAGIRYDENTVIFQAHAEMLLRYQAQFDFLWAGSRNFEHVDLARLDTPPVDSADIAAADAEDIEVLFTSDNFETTQSTRYGPGFRVLPGHNTVSDALVELIESAESSILLASGHLRSRPVALALIEAVNANPALEVRIYTDGQEFLSASSHARQVSSREDCLADAAMQTPSRQEAATMRCYDRGFLYAYELFQQGIDVRFKHYSYRWHYSYAPQMHHKYMIIDEHTVATGSYNLSDNAEHNTMENVVVFTGPAYAELTARYVSNFDAMWSTGRMGTDIPLYDELMDDVQNGTDEFPIVYEAMALGWDQIDVLKRAMRNACDEIDTNDFRRNPRRHHTCQP